VAEVALGHWLGMASGSRKSVYRFVKSDDRAVKLCCLLVALLLPACNRGESASPVNVFPGADAVPGWTPVDEVEVFDAENIYDLVDGQAEAFFAYGFEQVMVRGYENKDGAVLNVEVWQLASPSDAFGLFTAGISGIPTDVGNDGDADPGRRLAWWQDRYYVHVRARQEVSDGDLRGFAEAVAAALPEGGERPALMGRLPTDRLVERSALFFHEEISVQNEVWLGGENLLGLGPEVAGVLARYDVGGVAVRLLLVEYPSAELASSGLAALEGGQVGGLVAADVRDTLLGAVFGEADTAAVNTLLAEALR
jgi:hypothetical protein